MLRLFSISSRRSGSGISPARRLQASPSVLPAPRPLHTSSWTIPHAKPARLEQQLASSGGSSSLPASSSGARCALFTLHPDLDDVPHYLSILRAWATHTRTELVGSFALPIGTRRSSSSGGSVADGVGKSISLAIITPTEAGESVRTFRSTLLGRGQAQVGRWQRSSFLPRQDDAGKVRSPGEENAHLAISSSSSSSSSGQQPRQGAVGTETGNSVRGGRADVDELKGSRVGDVERTRRAATAAGDDTGGWENLWRTSIFADRGAGDEGGQGALVGLDGRELEGGRG